MNANIPDGHALGEGKTITFGVLGQGSPRRHLGHHLLLAQRL